jgi:hypothetical protein
MGAENDCFTSFSGRRAGGDYMLFLEIDLKGNQNRSA